MPVFDGIPKTICAILCAAIIGGVAGGCQPAGEGGGKAGPLGRAVGDDEVVDMGECGVEEEAPPEPQESWELPAARLRFAVQGADAQSAAPHLWAGVQEYMARNPQVVVELEASPVDDYQTKLIILFAAGDMPDLQWVPSRLGSDMAEMECFAGLSGWLEEQPEVAANLLPGGERVLQWEGEIYGMPGNLVACGLWYNLDLMEMAGINVPQTWGDYLEAAGLFRDLQGMDLIARGAFLQALPPYLLCQSGYDERIVGILAGEDSWQNGEFLAAYSWLKDMAGRGDWSTTEDTAHLFYQGEAPLLEGGSWQVEELDGADIPLGFTWGPGFLDTPLVYPNGAITISQWEPQEASFDLLAFLYSGEGADIWLDAGRIPPTRYAVSQEDRNQYGPAFSLLLEKIGELESIRPGHPFGLLPASCAILTEEAIARMMLEEDYTPEVALYDTATQLSDELEYGASW